MKKFKLEEKVFEAEDASGVIDFMRKDSCLRHRTIRNF